MDANGTQYQLLLGENDWASCLEGGSPLSNAWNALGSPPSPPVATDFYWDPKRHQLTLWPQLYAFPPNPDDPGLLPSNRRGAAADWFGNFYFIDPTNTQILVLSSGDQTLTTFWPPGKPEAPAARPSGFGDLVAPAAPVPRMLSGLAVTRRHYLVVGGTDPAALILFDLYRGGEPRILLWPEDVPFAPFDMAAAPGGGVFILDPVNRRYWSLDANFAVCRGDDPAPASRGRTDSFQPLAGSPPQGKPDLDSPPGQVKDGGSPLSATNPIAIEALPDGTVLILDLGGAATSCIERYRGSVRIDAPFPVDAIAPLLPQGVTMTFTGQDLAFVPTPGSSDPLSGQVLVALAVGAQSLAFAASSTSGGGLELQPLPDYYPMRRFGGRAIFYANGTPYYDFTDWFIPLVMQKRPQYVTSGTITTPVFDAGLPGCVWHRLILDAAMPLGTSIQIQSRAADDPQTLSESPFLPEPPRLYLRTEGIELPFTVLSAGLSSYELLFQQARGRYLQLQITLSGNARSSPRIRAMRAYYPRFSYVKQYMPAAYTDNDTVGLLDRFMANFEGLLTPIEDRVAAVQELFDPRIAPYDTLAWLAAWFGVSMDPTWDNVRQRLFIRHAMDFFQWRGTVRGIQMALDLVLSQNPCDAIFTNTDNPRPSGTRIVEQFTTRVTPPSVAAEPSTPSIFGPAPPTNTWNPSLGGDALVTLWSAAATAAGLAVQTTFPVTAPTDSATAAAWTAFATATLGFVPSATTTDQARWTLFLQRRYPSLANFNTTYGTSYVSLAAVSLPTTLPPDGPPLVDWFQFEGIVLPIAQNAHRFRVLIPLPAGMSSDTPAQKQQLDLIKRLVKLEKPAHTVFDVSFYWAMFSIGQARLGYDTLLQQGSRMPDLAPSMVLGYGYLLEGHLAPGFPQDATHRDVAGRNPLGPGSNA